MGLSSLRKFRQKNGYFYGKFDFIDGKRFEEAIQELYIKVTRSQHGLFRFFKFGHRAEQYEQYKLESTIKEQEGERGTNAFRD